jgi:primosomal protein N' (replication factor Y)
MAREFAEVVLPLPIDRPFTYGVPEHLRGTLRPGHRVRVPFRAKTLSGFVVGFPRQPPSFEVRDIAGLHDPEPLIDEKLLDLGRWIADTYLCSWGQAVDAMIPGGVKRPTAGRTIAAARPGGSPPSEPPKTDAQRRIFDALKGASEPVPVASLLDRVKATRGPLTALVKAGYVQIVQLTPEMDSIDAGADPGAQDLTPTPDQARAIAVIQEAISGAPPRGVLLHGVTGSGKTEVYLRALRRVVDSGRQAIVMVPEIALTPQTVARFRARFPRLAVLHSVLAETDRARHWRAIRAGEVDVVVGARSAIFAPVRSLGLVVLDEEHEQAYKQESEPRYHAREVALRRADREGGVVVLGSATPSLESMHAARIGRLRLATLPRRIEERPLPPVEIVDMAEERRDTKRYPLISRALEQAVKAATARGEQVLLFLNRRGYTTVIRCRRCEWVFRCKRCDITVTYHKTEKLAECHTCGATYPLPDSCPACRTGMLGHFGVGTERIEEEIRRRLPELAVSRMDSDRMRTRRDYREALGGLWSGETDVVVGTQMIAKGLDVPNVTVIGVVNADVAFYLPDFRAAERTFHLLTQVAGRAGRGPRGGRVIVQTFNPTHYSIACAAAYDEEGFVEKELASRRDLGYPPFSRLVRIVFQGFSESAVRAAADRWGRELAEALPPLLVSKLGPAPAPFFRVKNRYRIQILLKTQDLDPVRKAIRSILERFRPSRSLQVVVDVDPVSMV